MKTLSYKKMLKVNSLPTPSATLEGVYLELATDKKPYYCDGTQWIDLTATGGSSATPGGSSGQIQFNNAGSFGGASNVSIHSGDLILAENASPVTPAANTVKFFGRKIAQRMFPAMVGQSAMDAAMQPSIWRQKIALATATGNSTTGFSLIGFQSFSVQGTATARNPTPANATSLARRLGYVSATTVGSFAGIRQPANMVFPGNGSGIGGFFASIRFSISDAAPVAGARMFVGMSNAVATPTNVEPSTLVNSIGIAQLSTDSTQLYLVYGGSSAQTPIPLGTNFPPMASGGPTGGDFYDFSLFSPPNQNGVFHYFLEKIGTNFVTTGTLTPASPGFQTPSNSTGMNPRLWRCNNATALAVALDVSTIYVETDY